MGIARLAPDDDDDDVKRFKREREEKQNIGG